MIKKVLLYLKQKFSNIYILKFCVKHYVLFIFLFVFLFFVLFTYKDFGITADEELEYNLGSALISYYTNYKEYQENSILIQKPYLKTYYHIYPMILNMLNYKGYYEWFHLLNMLFGTTIFIFGYIFFNKIYNNKYFSILFCLLLITTPRLLGHLPANPKDMPFAIMYFISFGLLYLTSQKTSIKKIIFIGILLGFTIGIRVIGYGLFFIFLIDRFLTNKKLTSMDFVQLIILLISSHFVLYLTWPFIFQNPLNIISVITNASNFAPWNREILFMGEFINKNQRPRYYLPMYFIITIPIFITITHLLSLKYIKDRIIKILMITIYINFFVYLIINPVIYNGLRHFLFLIPLLVATSTIYLINLLKSKNKTLKKAIFYTLSIYIFIMAFQIYKIHPYQYTYFNIPTRYLINISDNFEVDYWGSSYKKATEKLLVYIDKNNIKMPNVYACNVDYAVRYYSKAKFEIVNKSSKADFIICDYQNYLKQNYNYKIFDKISVNNIDYNYLIKVR